MKERKVPEIVSPSESLTVRRERSDAEHEAADALADKKEARVSALHSKLAPELRALLDLKRPITSYSHGKVTVKDGKIAVQVWLTRATDEVLQKLKEKGLEISFSAVAGKMVIGTVSVDKLAELVKIQEITRIEPLPVG